MKEREFVDKCFSKKLHGIPDTKSSLTNIVDDITYMLTTPTNGLIKTNRQDIKKIADASKHLLGLSAEAKGRYRAEIVGKELVSNYLSTSSKNKPTSAIFNVIGGSDLKLFEVTEISERIYSVVDPEADIVFCAIIDDNKKDYIKTTVIFGSN